MSFFKVVSKRDYKNEKRNRVFNDEYNENQRKINVYKSMEKWLSYFDWDFFLTFTTKYDMGLYTARALMSRFFDKLVSDFEIMNVLFFWVAEKFEVKDGYHTHAIICFPKDELFDKDLFNIIRTNYNSIVGLRSYNKKRQSDLSNIYKNEGLKAFDENLELKKVENFRVGINKFDRRLHGIKYCAKYMFKNWSDYNIHLKGFVPKVVHQLNLGGVIKNEVQSIRKRERIVIKKSNNVKKLVSIKSGDSESNISKINRMNKIEDIFNSF